jgi:hypothetical protein
MTRSGGKLLPWLTAMSKPPSRRRARLTPEQWVENMLAHKGVRSSGIARRQRSNVPVYMTVEVLRAGLRKKDYTLIISGENYIAISHDRPIAIYR